MARFKKALVYAKFGVALAGAAVLAAQQATDAGGSWAAVGVAVGTAVFVFLTKNADPEA
jgi:hypothetical protein